MKLVLLLAVCFGAMDAAVAQEIDVAALLAELHTVGPRGARHEEAMAAYRELAGADAARLPEILAGLDDAGPLAANWIRAAVDTIAERHLARGSVLPQAELEEFLADPRHAPRGRRLAYEWVARVDETARNRLIPGMLNDPSLELRRDAVRWALARADQLAQTDKKAAVTAYRKALSAARDRDQVDAVAKKLTDLGQEVDLPSHFGFVREWQLIGPLDNTDRRGFHMAYAPEKEYVPAASYPGKFGEVKWARHTTTDKYGTVDLNAMFGMHKQVIAYARTEFVSDGEQDIELRVASYNANRVWLNGQLLASNEIYHAGEQFDQYVARGTLKKGRNVILLKVCQNEQTQSWARHWRFKLRVCDERGTAVLAANRTPVLQPGDRSRP